MSSLLPGSWSDRAPRHEPILGFERPLEVALLDRQPENPIRVVRWHLEFIRQLRNSDRIAAPHEGSRMREREVTGAQTPRISEQVETRYQEGGRAQRRGRDPEGLLKGGSGGREDRAGEGEGEGAGREQLVPGPPVHAAPPLTRPSRGFHGTARRGARRAKLGGPHRAPH